jgi:hypothetical protein
VYNSPVLHDFRSASKKENIGRSKSLFFPPKCRDILNSLCKETQNDPSTVCHDAFNRWDNHLLELALPCRRGIEYLEIPHRFGCKRVEIFILDSDIARTKATEDVLCDSGLGALVAPDYGSLLLAALQFVYEGRK